MGIILLVTVFIGATIVLLMNNMHKKEIKELELIIEDFENCFAQKREKLSTLHDDYWKLESRYTKKVREVESVWDKIRQQERAVIDFSKEITELKDENLKLSEQLSGQQKAYKLLTERLTRAIHKCETFELNLSATEHHRNVLQNHLTEVKDNFDSLQKEYDNLYGENVSLKEDVEHLEDDVEIKMNELSILIETVQQQDISISEYEIALRVQRDEIHKLQNYDNYNRQLIQELTENKNILIKDRDMWKESWNELNERIAVLLKC